MTSSFSRPSEICYVISDLRRQKKPMISSKTMFCVMQKCIHHHQRILCFSSVCINIKYISITDIEIYRSLILIYFKINNYINFYRLKKRTKIHAKRRAFHKENENGSKERSFLQILIFVRLFSNSVIINIFSSRFSSNFFY